MKIPIASITAELGLPLLAPAACSDWALNTYVQCEYRCVYCITGVQGVSHPKYARDDVPRRLRQELVDIPSDAHIGVGGFCDAYPSVERDHRVTRAAVEEIAAQGLRFTIITKGSVVVRDIDLLADNPQAEVRISLCTVDEAALRRVDPVAPTAAARIAVLRRLRDAGVQVGVSAAPWIPEVSDAAALIDAIGDAIPISFAPLNVVSDAVARSPYGQRFRQAEIDGAYRREYERVGARPNVTWRPPRPPAGAVAGSEKCAPLV